MEAMPNQENTPKDYQVWRTESLSKSFLEGVRKAIPLAREQIEMILRIIQATQDDVKVFMDLGCGDGILGRTIYEFYPQAKGCFLDISETMMESARKHFANSPYKPHFILQDFGNTDWINSLSSFAPFDVIVSGFSIHHQTDERKKEIYSEIYHLLKPGGLFLNLEHVSSKTSLGEELFDKLFVDSLYAFHLSQGSTKTREEIDKEYYNREDKTANILAPVELQTQWLEEIGFVHVDCFFKIFEITLFGGLRPKDK